MGRRSAANRKIGIPPKGSKRRKIIEEQKKRAKKLKMSPEEERLEKITKKHEKGEKLTQEEKEFTRNILGKFAVITSKELKTNPRTAKKKVKNPWLIKMFRRQ